MAAFGDAGNLFGNGLPSSQNLFNSNPNKRHESASGSMFMSGAKQHTQRPMVTGTSIVSIKYDGGVMIGADTLGSYGYTARFKDVRRIFKANDSTLIAASGDISDYQYIQDLVGDLIIESDCQNDGHTYTPKSIYNYMGRVMYNRRTKMNPLWNTVIIGGFTKEDGPFLGHVDKVGVAYENDTISTGYGAYMAQPLLRKALELKPVLTKEEARKEIEAALRVLFYRDTRALPTVQIASVDASGCEVSEPFELSSKWDIATMVTGYE